MINLSLPQPYLLFLGDTTCERDAKTAFGLRAIGHASAASASMRCRPSTVTTSLPRLTPAQARAKGARSLVIGVAPVGGVIAPAWVPDIGRGT